MRSNRANSNTGPECRAAFVAIDTGRLACQPKSQSDEGWWS